MSKTIIATIADVENALVEFVAAAEEDPTLESRYAKKLGVVIENLTVKSDVTKELNQAYTIGEKWWAVNTLKGKEGCTKENEIEKIRWHVLNSKAWVRNS